MDKVATLDSLAMMTSCQSHIVAMVLWKILIQFFMEIIGTGTISLSMFLTRENSFALHTKEMASMTASISSTGSQIGGGQNGKPGST